MAISNSYISPRSAKLREKMKLYFSEVLKNNNFQTLESLDKIQSWYKEKYEIENTNVDIYDILSTLTNKIIEKLLEYSEPHYEDTIVDRIGIRTKFKDGLVQTDFEIGFIPLEPYVKYVMNINKKEIDFIKFQFLLETNTYIKKFTIENNDKRKIIFIDQMGVEFKLSLVKIETTNFVIDKNIEFKSINFEIKDVILYKKISF